jgi:hypothetical protein
VALTRASGRTALALARDGLGQGQPLGIEVPPWTGDPQGFYMVGNNMALAPRALLRLGEICRAGGAYGGVRALPRPGSRLLDALHAFRLHRPRL